MAYDLGLADRVRTIIKRRGEFSERKMFGGLTFMVNDRMCCGIIKTDLVLKLTPELATEALAKPHTRLMDFSGKPMKSMIYVDALGTDREEELEEWVAAALRVAKTEAPASKPAARKASRANSSRRSS